MGTCVSSTATTQQEEARDTIEVTLRRSTLDTPLGLTMGRNRKGVVVYAIDEGSLIDIWNLQNPDKEIFRFDRIISVNGVQSNRSWNSWLALVAEAHKEVVHLVIEPAAPRKFEPKMDKAKLEEFLHKLDEREKGCLNVEDSLPLAAVTPSQAVDAEDVCSICLDTLQGNGRVVVLPCHHALHRECAEKWLSGFSHLHEVKCPLCRKHVDDQPGEKQDGPAEGQPEGPAQV